MPQPPTSARKPRPEREDSPRTRVTKSAKILEKVQDPRLGRPYKDDEEKRRVYYYLAYLKSAGKKNWECATELAVSERTVNNYLADELYTEIQNELQADAKQMGHTTIAFLIDDAIDVLVGLMYGSNSDFVRFKAAEKFMDVAGYNLPREEAHKDSRDEVAKFLEMVRGRNGGGGNVNIQVNIVDGEEKRGGTTHPNPQVVIEAEQVDPTEQALLSPPTPAIPAELAQYYTQVLPGGRLPDE